MIHGVRPLETAADGDLTFLMRGRTPPPRAAIRAAAIIIHEEEAAQHFPDGTTLLRSQNPHLGFAKALDYLYPPAPPPFTGVASTAFLHPTVEVGEGTCIAPGVFVGAGTRLGRSVYLYPGVYVGQECTLGDRVTLHPRVTLYPGTSVGARSTIHAGSVIGGDGFGFVLGESGPTKIQHLGHVRIEADVDVGANCTIDRGSLDDTVVGRGSKIDNLVHIGHNSVIGPHCVIAGQAGLAGSCTLGSGVVLAGQVGLAGHLTIGDGAQVGAKSGVHSDVPAGAKFFGYPATHFATAARAHALLGQLPQLRKQLTALAKAVDEMRDRLGRPDGAR